MSSIEFLDKYLKENVTTVAVAAEFLAVSTHAVRDMIGDGRIDGIKFGTEYLLTKSSVSLEFKRRYPNFIPPKMKE